MKYKFKSFVNDLWYSKVRFFSSHLLYFISRLFFILKLYRNSRELCARSLRYGVIDSAILHYKKTINKIPYSLSDVSSGVSLNEAALRSIIVKWPSYSENEIEKGIIIITFTKTFSYYARNIDLQSIQNHFFLVFEPSWSGYADPDIFYFYKRCKNIIISCSEQEDRILVNCFRETFLPVSFGASDWVDYQRFSPLNVEKQYDSVYVANTRPIKRVKRYLDAVKSIVASGYPQYKALLICAAWGGEEALVKKLVCHYELENNVELKFSLGISDLIENVCKSKINILLSYKEGSNRSLFESMCCDVPVVCLSENVGVNKSYINEFTGILVPDMFLEYALISSIEDYKNFRPRSWALNNISPEVSTKKMINALPLGKEDISTVYVKTNNPEVGYFDYPKLCHKEYSKAILEVFGTEVMGSVNVYKKQILNIKNKFNQALSA